MKKFILIPFLALFSFAASAQYYQDSNNPDILKHDIHPSTPPRVEFVLPQVNGYTLFKSDLHVHTMFSDGTVTPEHRVQEAWFDGLDVIAITDHIEHRPYEEKLLEFVKPYTKKGTKPVNNIVVRKDATKEGFFVDLNVPVALAQKEAEKYGIVIIPGTEITREPKVIGHYNALFVTDSNAIYDTDPFKAIQNAKAQGAIVMHNHPGWTRPNMDILEFEQKVYDAGLIDGIEIMNGGEFYPKAIDRALKYNFYMSSNTDLHPSSAESYRAQGNRRPMTFILAKDSSLESLREALEAKRTIAYSFGSVAGPEALLKALFDASVQVKYVSTDSKGRSTVTLTNNTSLNFLLRTEGYNKTILKPFTTVRLTFKAGDNLCIVENFWVSSEERMVVNIKW